MQNLGERRTCVGLDGRVKLANFILTGNNCIDIIQATKLKCILSKG